ncbi:UNVERIFIED_CONTAM: tRNA N(3)-methylcytidine methyltransferase METTL6 [Sesamum radiatum]|uniref:tRNA N(3)-methylcytidine methyltransferase METTL6 n=1 Tax=Sesamum radiatum TaxID=300843 RepID=A0AAW2PHL9_SESRA
MTASMTMLPSLCCSSTVDRKMSSHLPAVRFEPLSCGKRTFDDVNEHYFSTKSLKCWDKFYKRHQNKIGCGAGNTIFPLIAAYPKLFVHACDFSTEALTLVKAHPNFNENQINLFICDVANDELCEKILPSSVDIVTLIFILSAVSPEKMPFVLQNLKKVLKPNGHILVRDYAVGDSAQCSFYFSEDFLSALFVKAGFGTVDMNIYCRQVENRIRNVAFQRYDQNAHSGSCILTILLVYYLLLFSSDIFPGVVV